MNLDETTIMLSKMENAVNIFRDVFDELEDIKAILAVVGTAFDEWCAEHEMSSEETCEALKELVNVQEYIHSTMGPADYIL